MNRRFLAALLCTAAAFALVARAQTPAPSKVAAKKTGDRSDTPFKGDPKELVKDASLRQAQFRQKFVSFTQKLAILAGRLENGTDKDKEKAKALRAALRLAGDRGVEGRFEAMILFPCSRATSLLSASLRLPVRPEATRRGSARATRG